MKRNKNKKDHGKMDHGKMDHSKMDHGKMDHSKMDHGTKMKQHDHQDHDHSAHIADFKIRFIVSTSLTIPILILSRTIQQWLGFEISFPFQAETVFIISTLVYFYGGWPFLKGIFSEIKKKRPGMMTLIAMAISVAFFYSAATVFFISGTDFFWELATLIDVMLLGHWVEAKSIMGASKALEELVKIMPTTAHLVRNGEIIDIPVSELEIGNITLIRPGEKIPSDGVVIEGDSYVNEAFLTGESKPVSKSIGDEVIGSSINSEGILRVQIRKTGEETYLSQVIKLVREAQMSKSRTQDLANRAAALLFYVAVIAGIITYSVWFSIGFPDFALERTVTVLVIACPHALGLAIPLVVALSTSITAKSGVLIRDRTGFERARKIDAIVFDKTGTLTEGNFGVTDIVALIPKKELLETTAALEINSEHIIAKAIVEYAEREGTKVKPTKEFTVLPGKGVHGIVDNKSVYVGSPNLLDELAIEIKDKRIKQIQKQGKTVVFVVLDNQLAGVFALSDQIREDSKITIKKLKEMGIRTYMLTGDAKEVAEWVAKELELDDYFAEVLPHEKADIIKQLKKQGFKVAMVGDGINDAPALVTADVGIAIGAGTDVAIESADVILVKSNPNDVIRLIELSQKTYSKMIQNLWWAAGYNIIAIPLAAGVLASLGVIINPAIGAILMSLSTIIVALNSQTLRKHEIKPV
ncbi:MAG: copper-translocating P-type ATPase [Candidatus Heimdallarchaeaceae archaeon]|jgi:Cu2+-exporting ATPase